jgi:Holliday junction resolvase RusA-like endonuclease
MWSFQVPGPIVPWKRAQTGMRGGYHHYTDKSRAAYMRLIATAALASRPAAWPMGAQYAVSIEFAHDKRTRQDIDNVVKIVGDALNKIVWDDDWQIDYVRCIRLPVDKASPRLSVEVRAIER